MAGRNDDIHAHAKAVLTSGKYARPRGELLGTIERFRLPVYEGSPQEWKDALRQEEPGC